MLRRLLVASLLALPAAAETIESYGGGVSVSNNTPALDAAIAAGEDVLEFGAGTYAFASKPTAIPHGMTLRGKGMSATELLRTYAETGAYTGFLTWNGAAQQFGGGTFDLMISTTQSGGSAIVLTGTDTTHRASVMEFRNLWITARGTAKWDIGVAILGAWVLDPSGTNGGIRDVRFDNLYVLQTLYNAVEAWGAKNLWIVGGQLANPGSLVVTGTSTSRSEHVFLDVSIAGTLYASQTNVLVFRGAAGSLWRNGTVDTLRIYGSIAGGIWGSPAVNEMLYP